MVTHSETPPSFAPDLPFQYIGGDPAMDLVNTVDWTSRGPEQDRLTDYGRLTRWAEGAGLLSPKAAASLRARAATRPREAEAAHRLALRLREVLSRLFGAIAQGELHGDALNDFNGLLGRALEGMRVAPAGKRARKGRGLELGWHDLEKSLDSIVWPVVWSAASLIVSEEDLAIELIHKLLENAASNGAQCIVTVCPMCQTNLDVYQSRVNRKYKTKFNLPVLFFTQLMGVAFGTDEKALGLGSGIIPAKRVLARYTGR